MRTTIDLPETLLRRLKSRAALEGTTLKSLLQTLVEAGLKVPPAPPVQPARSALPSVGIGRPLLLRAPSNARLFELLDED